MTNIDQFESVFKSADKQRFKLGEVSFRRVLIVSDGDVEATNRFAQTVRAFLDQILVTSDPLEINSIAGNSFTQVAELLEQVELVQPDLICTYRNLHAPALEHPFSLGTYVDVLTQATSVPVMLLAHPARPPRQPPADSSRNVMAITDHLTGDHRLVSTASSFTKSGGNLVLAHIEDEATFDRYVETISRIPALDTELARDEIYEQLLKEPRDYVQSCRDVLASDLNAVSVESIVIMGNQLADYRRLVQECDVALLVINTKNDEQLAMHGLAYPLTIELRDTPMLLL